ncbi:hypothetical protein ACFQ7B_05765 [Streptomyces erythrochromogenes]
MDYLSAAADILTVLSSALSIGLEVHRARNAGRTDDGKEEETR